jgi:hypothetical protein
MLPCSSLMIVIWRVTRQGYGCSGETSWLTKLSLQQASQCGMLPCSSLMIVIWRVTGQGYGCSGETSWLTKLS